MPLLWHNKNDKSKKFATVESDYLFACSELEFLCKNITLFNILLFSKYMKTIFLNVFCFILMRKNT